MSLNHNPESHILECSNLQHQVGTGDSALTILAGINLQLKRGDSLAIMGASGSGKTTLLGLLAGLSRANSGQIMLCGQPLHELDEEQRAAVRRQRVGFVFQSFQLLDSLSALDNVRLPLEMTGIKAADKRAREALDQVGLSARLNHFPAQLSGGEQQRVALARAFAPQPKILFADEPTGNLDHANGKKVADLLLNLNQQYETALLMVTHDAEMAHLCHSQSYLQAGYLHSGIAPAI